MTSPSALPVEVRTITVDQVRPLRHSVLRPSQPFDATIYPGDDDPGTRHFGAFDGERLVGIASLYREARAGTASGEPEWRLRGMATAPDARGRGAGRALLAACVAHAAGAGGGVLWCNARTPALGFYLAAGLQPLGDEFDIPGIGPHVVMVLAVPPVPVSS